MTPSRSLHIRLFAAALLSTALATTFPVSADDQQSHNLDAARDSSSPPQSYSRLWVGVSGALDFVYLPVGTDVCKLGTNGQPANGAHYYCMTTNGSDFPTPAQNASLTIRGQAGSVGGGLEAGDVRVMLAVDYAATANILAGVRLGYVFNAYPGEAAVKDGRALGFRVHAEVRGTYVFGQRPLAHVGFAPLVFLGGGVSQFDGYSASAVTFDNVVGQQPVVAWLTDAPFFFVVGSGFRYQLSSRLALTVALRFNGAIGGNGFLPTFGPEVTLQHGWF
jgi:hypothetical protein